MMIKMKIIMFILGFLAFGLSQPFEFNQSTLLAGYFFVEVPLDGTTLGSDDLEGAFNGDICVGAHQWDTSGYNNGVCEIT